MSDLITGPSRGWSEYQAFLRGYERGDFHFSFLLFPPETPDTQAVNRPLLGLYQLPKTLASKTRPSAETVLIIKMIFLMIM